MKNKGFTLVELLGVMIILAVIFVLVFPSVQNIISQSEDTIYQKQINTILNATYDFTLKNVSYLPDTGQKSYVTLGQLKYDGLIDANIEDPNTNEIFPDNLVISINNVGAGYEYSNTNSKLEGDYLYTVEIENLSNPNLNDLLPKITLYIDNEELEPNSDGNYIKILNLNETLEDISYSASNNGIDLTSKVRKNIILDEKAVDNIDSSIAGIYKINYSVVDDNGYASVLVYNVIVGDEVPPTITLSEETVISKDVISFDLLKGVSCEDNSGFCYIEYSPEIDFGVVGKQIIEYTAKDPTGNTATKRRVITIE